MPQSMGFELAAVPAAPGCRQAPKRWGAGVLDGVSATMSSGPAITLLGEGYRLSCGEPTPQPGPEQERVAALSELLCRGRGLRSLPCTAAPALLARGSEGTATEHVLLSAWLLLAQGLAALPWAFLFFGNILSDFGIPADSELSFLQFSESI